MNKEQNLMGIIDTLRSSWFLIAFIAGMIYWVARQDSSLNEIERNEHRITSLENRTTILESGIGQLQMKIDGIKEDVTLIKSAVIKQ
ncbi:MAG: hypothetical protein K2L95_03975 [Alphaproteobacteria bacterium]|nr:hypothetical protein [Alphaproteobacteria bacterium]MDE6571341.1 hypothetical protein [Alphaproteobacteria bacterium]